MVMQLLSAPQNGESTVRYERIAMLTMVNKSQALAK
jgi:hypothetical protein